MAEPQPSPQALQDGHIRIGRFVATFGVQGELILEHALGKKSDLKGIKALFVEESKAVYIPYFLSTAKARSSEETIVSLEGVVTREQAHRFIRKPVWLLETDAAAVTGARAPLALIGYLVVDQRKELSVVEEVIEQPHQMILKITLDGHEVLIPLHEETLERIDKKARRIYVTLPDGLIELYLGE